MKTTKISRKVNRWKQYYLRPLLGAVLLCTWMSPALADGTAAGTTIDNTAYGSFESPANPGTPIDVQSNKVTITIAEIAGIDVTAEGVPVEAPGGVDNAGPSQGDGVLSSEDVIYFTYRITNIGNDQTQFFIPDSPSSVTNGTFDATATGPIEVVGYSADGINTTTISGETIPAGGTTTGTLSSLPNGGSVPVDGYIDVRIPIKADAGLDPATDQITVVLGNTPDLADQNVPYTAGGEFSGNNDVFTQDNPDGVNGDLTGSPNPEREASDSQIATLGVPNLDYGDAPDVSPAEATDDYQTVPGRGPSHVVDGVTFLGSGVDAENAAFDDGPAEDDGVALDDGSGTTVSLHGQSIIPGQNIELDVTTAGTGVLNAWIDFNRDGVFDTSEQVAVDETPTGNTVTINSTVPFSAVAGDTYARFRYSSATGLGPNDAAPDGEVEDYQITIVGAAPDLKLVKRVTSIGGTPITTVTDDPGDTNDDAVNWPAGYLEGDIDATAEPSEEVDYTIYFLSDGNSEAANVRLCDLVPENTTYVAGSLELSQGGAAAVALTDANDGDAGEAIAPGAPIVAPCQGTNSDGGVYVTVPGNLPNATAPGTPNGSYGYIRFSVTVD